MFICWLLRVSDNVLFDFVLYPFYVDPWKSVKCWHNTFFCIPCKGLLRKYARTCGDALFSPFPREREGERDHAPRFLRSKLNVSFSFLSLSSVTRSRWFDSRSSPALFFCRKKFLGNPFLAYGAYIEVNSLSFATMITDHVKSVCFGKWLQLNKANLLQKLIDLFKFGIFSMVGRNITITFSLYSQRIFRIQCWLYSAIKFSQFFLRTQSLLAFPISGNEILPTLVQKPGCRSCD